MMKDRRVKYIIVIMLFLFELLTIFLTVKSYTNKDIDKIKEVSKIDKKMFTMYIEQDDGTYKEETDTNYFPSIGYRINEEKTYCVDHYGEEIDQAITFKDGSITVTGNKTVFCTLYFKKKGDDITVTVSTSGTAGVTGYKTSITCDTADSSFNEKYKRLEVSAATTDEVKCNVDFTKADTSSFTTLKAEVESKATAVSSTNNAGTSETNYRYTGKTPSNWVWFNNEMWRIIGSIPTCTSSGCATSENLVKIIRLQSLGSVTFDAKSIDYLNANWGSNTLYSLLNTHYYATSVDKMNGQNHSGCYIGQDLSSKPNCDYRYKGILSKSYYGRMLKNIYWNTGLSNFDVTASTAYTNETATQTVAGYIGLMSLSDLGYAADSSYYSTSLFYYDDGANETNWLIEQTREWLITSKSVGLANYKARGSVYQSIAYEGFSIRPVIYLNSSVYIIDGTGTQSDPYIIGM